MAAGKLVGSVKYYWEEVDDEICQCEECEDIIYGKAHQLVYYHWQIGAQEQRIVDICLCESCYTESSEDYQINFDPWDDSDISLN